MHRSWLCTVFTHLRSDVCLCYYWQNARTKFSTSATQYWRGQFVLIGVNSRISMHSTKITPFNWFYPRLSRTRKQTWPSIVMIRPACVIYVQYILLKAISTAVQLLYQYCSISELCFNFCVVAIDCASRKYSWYVWWLTIYRTLFKSIFDF